MQRLKIFGPWYIWFSAIAIFPIMMLTAHQIASISALPKTNDRPSGLRLWVGFFGNFYLWGMAAMVPGLITLAVFSVLIFQFGDGIETLRDVVMYIILYASGVFWVYMFDRWRRRKIVPHVQSRKRCERGQ